MRSLITLLGLLSISLSTWANVSSVICVSGQNRVSFSNEGQPAEFYSIEMGTVDRGAVSGSKFEPHKCKIDVLGDALIDAVCSYSRSGMLKGAADFHLELKRSGTTFKLAQKLFVNGKDTSLAAGNEAVANYNKTLLTGLTCRIAKR